MNENPESNTGEAQNAEVIKKGVGDVIQSIKGLESELSAEVIQREFKKWEKK